jgi:hypothetical protein
MTAADDSDHAVALDKGQWSVWRDALLRTTGFPASGLTRLSAAECASAADDHLAARTSGEEFDEVFAKAVAGNSLEIYRLASSPLLREAITWQNLSGLIAVEKILEAGSVPRRTGKHRQRERMIARYWQRYCGKAETVGFFGPVCWATVDPAQHGVLLRPGARLIRDRVVHFDHWPLSALAEQLAADPAVRIWLAPALSPQLTLRGQEVIDPVRAPVQLTAAQFAVVSGCDGRKTARQVAEEVAGGRNTGLRNPADVYFLLAQFAEQGILRWDFDLPVSLDAERVLGERISRIGDGQVRAQAEAKLAALRAHRDLVAAAADPRELAEALRTLDRVFTDLSGRTATRRAGEMYACRTLCVEEATRDLDATFGHEVIEAIAAPITVPLAVARWICCWLTDAYRTELKRIYAELAADLGAADVPLGMLWFLAQSSFYGDASGLSEQLASELAGRWSQLFGLEALQPPSTGLTVTSGSLTDRLAELFPADEPGWAAARIHSLDLHFCATDADCFAQGQFTAVLGELHAAWIAGGIAAFVGGHPEPERLRRSLRRDLDGQAIYPLLPPHWPRNVSRLAFALEDPGDVQFAFAAAPGADRHRLVPISSVVVRPDAGGLIACAEDGRSWPLIEFFGRLLSEAAVEAFKAVGRGRQYTPRITVDRLVIARESWRQTVGDCPVATAKGEREEYLATRRWRAALGLPEYVFVKPAGETKPLFVDMTSPVYASTLAAALRASRSAHGDAAEVVVTEMLPLPGQAWVPDAAAERYVAELRVHVRDDLFRKGKGERSAEHNAAAGVDQR